MTREVAIQGARHAARTIDARLRGEPAAPFRYVDRGSMATIGRHAAVAELPGGIKLYRSWYVSGVSAATLSQSRRSALLDHKLRSEANAASLVRSLEREELSE